MLCGGCQRVRTWSGGRGGVDGGDQPEGTGDVDVEGVLDVKLVLACSNNNSNSTSQSAIRRKLKKERDLVG